MLGTNVTEAPDESRREIHPGVKQLPTHSAGGRRRNVDGQLSNFQSEVEC